MNGTGSDKGGDGYGVSGSGVERERMRDARASGMHGELQMSGIMEMRGISM